MSKEEYRVQCRLRKQKPTPESGFSYQVTWLPEKFATVGRIVKLKKGEQWDDGWEVINVWQRLSAKEIRERSRYHLTQRRASDI